MKTFNTYLKNKSNIEEKQYNLTTEEFAILEQINSKESRRKSQSLLRFLKKQIIKNNGSFCMSFAKIHYNYNRWVGRRKKERPELKTISLKQIKNLINQLADFGLIRIEKAEKTNCYFLPLPNKLPDENSTENTENTDVIETENCPMILWNNIDIDSYSNSQKFDSTKYKKCTSFVDVRRRVRELLDKARVKSSFIRDSIMNGISKNYRNITEKFLDNYILKAIENARLKATKTWNELNKKQGVQANFTQRDDYDWTAVEEALLSHY
ncbi:plasmid replication protein [Clostridium perfringens]